MKLKEFDSIQTIRDFEYAGQRLPVGTEADVVDIHPDRNAFILESGPASTLTHVVREHLEAFVLVGRGRHRFDPPLPLEEPERASPRHSRITLSEKPKAATSLQPPTFPGHGKVR